MKVYSALFHTDDTQNCPWQVFAASKEELLVKAKAHLHNTYPANAEMQAAEDVNTLSDLYNTYGAEECECEYVWAIFVYEEEI